MLGKLIQYEFKASGRLIPIAYLVVALLAISGIILSAVRMYIYMTLSMVLLLLAGGAAMIITYIIVLLRFWRSMYGSEGYLMMTLPVTPTQLYLSKTIVAFCWMLLSAVVTLFAWFSAITSWLLILWEEIGDVDYSILHEMSDAFSNFITTPVAVMGIVLSLAGMLSFLAIAYFCMTIANTRPFQGMGFGAALIAYVVISIFNSILNTALTFAIPLLFSFNSETGWSIVHRNWLDSFSYYDFTVPVATYAMPFLYAVLLPILTIYLIRRKVNLR